MGAHRVLSQTDRQIEHRDISTVLRVRVCFVEFRHPDQNNNSHIDSVTSTIDIL
jgi:hypothetical protein